MNTLYDIAVVGSGFAGSLFAMVARRLGKTVLLLERGRHPRVVIGESSTPLSNLLLEDLARRYDLPAVLPLTRWGSWQQRRPEIACGLKRGFSFLHHDLSGRPPRPHEDQMMVAASPHNEIADTHWYRADVDQFLVEQARKLGVTYVDQVQLNGLEQGLDEVQIHSEAEGSTVTYRARFLVDATGPRGFLHRALGLLNVGFPGYPEICSLHSHFSGVTRLDEQPVYDWTGSAPYPLDDAAVHHVFDGGWIWILRFNNGKTSAGVAATASCAARLQLSEGASAWTRLLEQMPTLQQQFADAQMLQPFTYTAPLSFRSERITGERWAMLPSAAGFVDPLLSTGFPLTLLGITRLAELVEKNWQAGVPIEQLQRYGKQTDDELLATSRLIAALYRNMNNFPVFRSLTLLYFAAASFSETARRLGKPEMASSFLLHDKPGFGEAMDALLACSSKGVPQSEAKEFEQSVLRAIEAIDVAGLSKRPPSAWYPVNAEDLNKAAWKLGASEEQIEQLLERAGFYSEQRGSRM